MPNHFGTQSKFLKLNVERFRNGLVLELVRFRSSRCSMIDPLHLEVASGGYLAGGVLSLVGMIEKKFKSTDMLGL